AAMTDLAVALAGDLVTDARGDLRARRGRLRRRERRARPVLAPHVRGEAEALSRALDEARLDLAAAERELLPELRPHGELPGVRGGRVDRLARREVDEAPLLCAVR